MKANKAEPKITYIIFVSFFKRKRKKIEFLFKHIKTTQCYTIPKLKKHTKNANRTSTLR
jgi:hypothetical protein